MTEPAPGAIPLEGRTVVITGAASGIGRALAFGFLGEGARVAGLDRDAGGLEVLAREGLIPHVVDVTDEGGVRTAIDSIARETGRLDILFNNAGVGGGRTVAELAEGEFERCIAIHLYGTLYGLKAALPIMRRQKFGRIINMLSRGAEASRPGWSAYGAAKAGAFALTRVAASEAKEDGVLINGMIPGPTRTGMNKGPDLQEPEAVFPGARWLATLPDDGPTGRVFWNRVEYRLFERG